MGIVQRIGKRRRWRHRKEFNVNFLKLTVKNKGLNRRMVEWKTLQ
jgi:hypothetical protein